MNTTTFSGEGFGKPNLQACTLGSLLAIALVFALSMSSFAADKLVVKDGGGTNTVFRVDDTGTVEVPNGLKWDNTNKWLGVATTNPQAPLHIVDKIATLPRGITSSQHSNDTAGGVLVLRKSRGTEASPLGLLNGDYIGGIQGHGYDGSSFQQSAVLSFSVDDAVSAGNVPIGLSIITGGSLNARSVRMRVTSSGNVGIGTTTPTQVLDVNSNGIRIRNSKTPVNSNDVCNQGDMAWDSNYVYVCVSSNLWKRASLGTW